MTSRAPDRRQAALTADISRVRDRLEWWRRDDSSTNPPPDDPGSGEGPIGELARRFGLSDFERDALTMAVAAELDGPTASLIAESSGGIDTRPTFALAMAALARAHWNALAPAAPLRWWHLIELGPGQTVASRPMQVDERILHELTGLATIDARLAGVLRVHTGPDGVRGGNARDIAPSQAALAAELVTTVAGLEAPVMVILDGDDVEGRVAVTHRLADGLGGRPYVVSAAALPAPGPELALTARLIDRELALGGGIAIIEPASGSDAVVDELVRLLDAPVLVHLGDSQPTTSGRLTVRRTVTWPTATEQLEQWREVLSVPVGTADHPGGEREAPARPGTLDDATTDLAVAASEVAQHYRLGVAAVSSIARELSARPEGATGDGLHRLCRQRCRVNLDGLAERIESQASWDDIILPPGQMELLRDISRQVRHRHRVYDEWGFAGATRRGLGVTALFSGESGTGKTLAAEVLAADLELDLYRIDLSATVSKYIGETEKNLHRLFAAAETSGAVLLFDEADALFGKRGEVKQAHDRYANLEVAYLLGRMESYRGLALLTTNLRGNMDRAFIRRLRFVVQFPFPDEAERARIWERMFPAGAPTKGIDHAALARLAVPGGAIRSIAVSAAFAAADHGSPITPAHVLRAAEVEYAKSDRSLTETEKAALS